MITKASSLNSRERLLRYRSLEGQNDEASGCMFFLSIRQNFGQIWNDIGNFTMTAIEMGRNDPRKIMYAIKMGLALSLVSLLIFWKEPFADAAQYSIWAVLTVIVMFEFSIGMLHSLKNFFLVGPGEIRDPISLKNMGFYFWQQLMQSISYANLAICFFLVTWFYLKYRSNLY